MFTVERIHAVNAVHVDVDQAGHDGMTA